jgi:hypothetical protein
METEEQYVWSYFIENLDEAGEDSAGPFLNAFQDPK